MQNHQLQETFATIDMERRAYCRNRRCSVKRKSATVRNTVWVARYESAHYLFEVFDSNPDRALDALHDGLRLHARQVGLAVEDWWNEECVELRQFAFGVFHRDGHGVFGKGGVA